MKNSNFQEELIKYIEKKLKFQVFQKQIPPQGMSSKVFFIKTNEAKEYAIKYGENAMNDVPALTLIAKEKIDIPVPKLYDNFIFENCPVLILEKINTPLLETIPVNQMSRYIPSMIINLKKIHQVKSNNAGFLSKTGNISTWKKAMLSKFTNMNSNLNWNSIANRECLDHKLILASVEKIIRRIDKTQFIEHSYSLLHTDFNQRNLFVDPKTDNITAIIDWGEAMFGDPIYDFARIRMYIWHFDLGNRAFENYNKLLLLTPEEKNREELYWLSRVIEYLAYYSEEMNEFNLGRIKLHQEFLKNYKWAK